METDKFKLSQAGNILIVEDDKFYRKLLRETLEPEGYEVNEAVSGEEAFKMIKFSIPDLVILDVVLPRLDGIKICKALKSSELTKTVPILMASGKSEKEEVIRGLNVGADDYITKPFYQPELLARVNALFRMRNLYSALEKERLNTQYLLDITRYIAATLDKTSILKVIMDGLKKAVNYKNGLVVNLSLESKIDILIVKSNGTFISKEFFTGKSISSKYTHIINDLNSLIIHAVHERKTIKQIKSDSIPLTVYLIIPMFLKSPEEQNFCLVLEKEREYFTDEEINFCEITANVSAKALENSFSVQSLQLKNIELKQRAITDGLTSAYNHRHFYELLDIEFENSKRHDRYLGCIMLDLDYFKNINDKHGHRVGDLILKEIASLIRKCIRKGDILARYGGEEFIILLPETNIKNSSLAAEKIRKTVEESSFIADRKRIRLTISAGVSGFPEHNVIKCDGLVKLADDALYKAKKTGRNKVVIA